MVFYTFKECHEELYATSWDKSVDLTIISIFPYDLYFTVVVVAKVIVAHPGDDLLHHAVVDF